MKRNIRILLFSLCLIVIASCKKDNSDAPTIFTMHCIDLQGNAVSGTSVTLYDNSSDYYNNSNILSSGYTDANGDISFSGLRSQSYYFYCLNNANCLTNFDAISVTPLQPGQTNAINVVMTAYGKLKVTNTSPGQNPYEIKINGQVYTYSLAYGYYITDILPVGTCTVEAIQLSGYVSTPTDNTYAVTISQCQSVNQDIP